MKNWYVVHTQTGFENKVKTILETGIAAKGLQDAISRIVIPTEQISEIRSGKKGFGTPLFSWLYPGRNGNGGQRVFIY